MNTPDFDNQVHFVYTDYNQAHLEQGKMWNMQVRADDPCAQYNISVVAGLDHSFLNPLLFLVSSLLGVCILPLQDNQMRIKRHGL